MAPDNRQLYRCMVFVKPYLSHSIDKSIKWFQCRNGIYETIRAFVRNKWISIFINIDTLYYEYLVRYYNTQLTATTDIGWTLNVWILHQIFERCSKLIPNNYRTKLATLWMVAHYHCVHLNDKVWIKQINQMSVWLELCWSFNAMVRTHGKQFNLYKYTKTINRNKPILLKKFRAFRVSHQFEPVYASMHWHSLKLYNLRFWRIEWKLFPILFGHVHNNRCSAAELNIREIISTAVMAMAVAGGLRAMQLDLCNV